MRESASVVHVIPCVCATVRHDRILGNAILCFLVSLLPFASLLCCPSLASLFLRIARRRCCWSSSPPATSHCSAHHSTSFTFSPCRPAPCCALRGMLLASFCTRWCASSMCEVLDSLSPRRCPRSLASFSRVCRLVFATARPLPLSSPPPLNSSAHACTVVSRPRSRVCYSTPAPPCPTHLFLLSPSVAVMFLICLSLVHRDMHSDSFPWVGCFR